MPLYVYKCEVCKRERDDMRTVAERHDGPRCCHQAMTLQVSAVPGIVKNPAVPRGSK